MASGFYHLSGPWELGTRASTASTAIAIGDTLKTSSGKVLPGTAGAKVLGVSLGTKAVGDSATTAVQFIWANNSRTKWRGYVKAGTLASTETGAQFDLSGSSGAQGFDADTTTNGDVYVDYILSTGTSSSTPQGAAVVSFSDPEVLSST